MKAHRRGLDPRRLAALAALVAATTTATVPNGATSAGVSFQRAIVAIDSLRVTHADFITVGCGCSSAPGALALLVALSLRLSSRRRTRR